MGASMVDDEVSLRLEELGVGDEDLVTRGLEPSAEPLELPVVHAREANRSGRRPKTVAATALFVLPIRHDRAMTFGETMGLISDRFGRRVRVTIAGHSERGPALAAS